MLTPINDIEDLEALLEENEIPQTMTQQTSFQFVINGKVEEVEGLLFNQI